MTNNKTIKNNEALYDFAQLIITLIGILLSVWLSYQNNPDLGNALYAGASVGIILFLISEKVSSIFKRSKSKAELELHFTRLEGLINGRGKMVLLGTTPDAFPHILGSVYYAKRVLNVYTSFGHGIDDYSDFQKQEVIDSIRTILIRDGSKWIDIVSPGRDGTDYDKDIVMRMTKVFEDKRVKPENYLCFCLKVNWPLMNFLLLDFGAGRDKEVYFGFGKNQYDYIGHVFLSTDTELVNLFERWHASLRESDFSQQIAPIV